MKSEISLLAALVGTVPSQQYQGPVCNLAPCALHHSLYSQGFPKQPAFEVRFSLPPSYASFLLPLTPSPSLIFLSSGKRLVNKYVLSTDHSWRLLRIVEEQRGGKLTAGLPRSWYSGEVKYILWKQASHHTKRQSTPSDCCGHFRKVMAFEQTTWTRFDNCGNS